MTFPLFQSSVKTVVVFMGLVVLTAPAFAQPTPASEPPPVPVPEEPMVVDTMGFIRVWFMVPSVDSPVELVLRQPGLPDSVLASQPYPYFYCGYVPVAPAGGTLVLRIAGSKEELVSAKVPLKKKAYFTALIEQSQRRFSLKIIDDTPKPPPPPGDPNDPPPPDKHVAIYQFLPEGVFTAVAKKLDINAKLEPGQSVQLDTAFAGHATLYMKGTLKGRETGGETDIDLSSPGGFSVLLIQDTYGRFSPRGMRDGTLD